MVVEKVSESDGSRLLAKATSERGAVTRLEKGIKCGGGLVSRWARGERVPSLMWAFKLYEACGIPMESWMRDSKPAKATRKKKAA